MLRIYKVSVSLGHAQVFWGREGRKFGTKCYFCDKITVYGIRNQTSIDSVRGDAAGLMFIYTLRFAASVYAGA